MMRLNKNDPRCPTCDTRWGYTTRFYRRRALQLLTACLLAGAVAGAAITTALRGVR